MTEAEQEYVAKLRIELRKQWDKAHDYVCNKKCHCESYGVVGKRCKYPLPEVLSDSVLQ